MNADGSNQVNLTNQPPGFHSFSPTWSPDGRQIAFSTLRDGSTEIYVMDADGSNPVRLTHDPVSDNFPAWKR